MDLVKQQLVEEYDAAFETTDIINDWGGNTIKVDAGIRSDTHITRGYGAQINNKGELHVIGDEYGQQVPIEKVQKMVLQNYRAVAYAQSLQKQGYRTQVQRQGLKVVLVGTHA